MSAYENTSVPVMQSKASIEAVLAKYHVTDIRWTQSVTDHIFVVEFNYPVKRQHDGGKYVKVNGRSRWVDHYKVIAVAGVRISIQWPDDEREQRRRARVLYWHLKSKLEAVEAGVVSFTEEFLPHIHIGEGRTVYDALAPMVARRSEEAGGDLSIAFSAALREIPALGSGR